MLTIRTIRPEDNASVEAVIRAVMPAFGCVGEGFSINDPEVSDMYTAYDQPGAAFYVLTDQEDRVVGVGGYAALAESKDAAVCELRKMYLLPEARGQGAGKKLLRRCLDAARKDGYRRMYLETVAGMEAAGALYKSHGFSPLDGPLGHTGHSGCDRYMLKELSPAD